MLKRFKETDYFIENLEYSQDKIDSDKITLLNWNIQKKNENEVFINELKEFIEDRNPSIILLQECRFKQGLEELLHLEHCGFIFAPNFIDIFKNHHSGVLTASKYKHKCATVVKSHAFEPIIKVPKIFLSAKYDIEPTGTELLVLNIHAINFVGFWKFISQIQQLEYAIKTHNGPVLLSGDFNTWNRRRTHVLDKILINAGMKKVEFEDTHKKNIKSFLYNNPLDHIFVKGMEVINEPQSIKTKSSDHNPLIVEFKLNL